MITGPAIVNWLEKQFPDCKLLVGSGRDDGEFSAVLIVGMRRGTLPVEIEEIHSDLAPAGWVLFNEIEIVGRGDFIVYEAGLYNELDNHPIGRVGSISNPDFFRRLKMAIYHYIDHMIRVYQRLNIDPTVSI